MRRRHVLQQTKSGQRPRQLGDKVHDGHARANLALNVRGHGHGRIQVRPGNRTETLDDEHHDHAKRDRGHEVAVRCGVGPLEDAHAAEEHHHCGAEQFGGEARYHRHGGGAEASEPEVAMIGRRCCSGGGHQARCGRGRRCGDVGPATQIDGHGAVIVGFATGRGGLVVIEWHCRRDFTE